jgi:hypothetical protein
VLQRFRDRRYARFVELLCVAPGDTIVDIASGPGTALEARNRVNQIVAVDRRDHAADLASMPNVTFVSADARSLPFADGEFDIAFCNSLIEHAIGEDRRAMAREVSRVASRFWVQTPNKWFPVEPHYMCPFYQYLPVSLRRRFDGRRGDTLELLDARELQRLFPDAEIERERFFGLTKSLIAVRR